MHDFWIKVFLSLYFINWTNLIVWLFVFVKLGNVCIIILCYPGCDIINFGINLIFLIKLFFYMNKKSRQKLKYLENEKSFCDEIKSIFHHFLMTFTNSNKVERWEFFGRWEFDFQLWVQWTSLTCSKMAKERRSSCCSHVSACTFEQVKHVTLVSLLLFWTCFLLSLDISLWAFRFQLLLISRFFGEIVILLVLLRLLLDRQADLYLRSQNRSHDPLLRSTHPELLCRKGFLKNFTKFTATLLKNRYGCSVNFAKFLRTPFS